MYFYEISSIEGSTTICSKNKYTKEEFNNMCKEATKHFGYWDYWDISIYLISKYRFRRLDITEAFNPYY